MLAISLSAISYVLCTSDIVIIVIIVNIVYNDISLLIIQFMIFRLHIPVKSINMLMLYVAIFSNNYIGYVILIMLTIAIITNPNIT